MEHKVLILTDGKAGHENQSKAFARALGCDFDLVEVHFKSAFHKLLSYLFDHLGIHTLRLFKPCGGLGEAALPSIAPIFCSKRNKKDFISCCPAAD